MYRDFSYTIYDNGLIEKFDKLTNQTFYYDHHWKQYLRDYSYSSENYVCSNCLRDKKLVKGSVRYDSLVLCQDHHIGFKPVIKKLYDVFDNLERQGKCTVYRSLGL